MLSGPGEGFPAQPRGLPYSFKPTLSYHLPDHCSSWWFLFLNFSIWQGWPWGNRHLVKTYSEWIYQCISWWYWHLKGELYKADHLLQGSPARTWRPEEQILKLSWVRENSPCPKDLPDRTQGFSSFKQNQSMGSPLVLSLPVFRLGFIHHLSWASSWL